MKGAGKENTHIPSLRVKMKQAPVVCEVIPGGLQPRLVAISPKAERNRDGFIRNVIPDLIRNLAFTLCLLLAWVRLEILKQVQDDRVGGEKGKRRKDEKDPLTFYSSPPVERKIRGSTCANRSYPHTFLWSGKAKARIKDKILKQVQDDGVEPFPPFRFCEQR